jgi:hypothetical protein
MDVETRISELRDLLGQELDSLGRVAEDDSLVDVQLGEQSVQAVQLFTFFEISIVLSHSLKGQLFHEVDELWLRNVLLLELLDLLWVSSRE